MLFLAWAKFKKADKETVSKLAVDRRVVDPRIYYDWLIEKCLARMVARQKTWGEANLVHTPLSATEKRKESKGLSSFKTEPLLKTRGSEPSSSLSRSRASRPSGRERKFKTLTEER